MAKCEHRYVKEIHDHGRNSKGYLVCPRCREVVKRYELAKNSGKRQKRRR